MRRMGKGGWGTIIGKLTHRREEYCPNFFGFEPHNFVFGNMLSYRTDRFSQCYMCSSVYRVLVVSKRSSSK